MAQAGSCSGSCLAARQTRDPSGLARDTSFKPRAPVRASAYGRRSALHKRLRGIILNYTMNDALEKRLVEALKRVDAHGDVAPARVHDPMTILLRENAVRANLVRRFQSANHIKRRCRVYKTKYGRQGVG